jgi:hypothetical protein
MSQDVQQQTVVNLARLYETSVMAYPGYSQVHLLKYVIRQRKDLPTLVLHSRDQTTKPTHQIFNNV